MVDGAEITTKTTIIAIIFMTMYQLRQAGVFEVVVVLGRWWCGVRWGGGGVRECGAWG